MFKSWLIQCAGPLLLLVGQVAAQPPFFIAETLDGTLPPAPLEKVNAEWSIQLGGTNPRRLSGAAWISLHQKGVPLPPFPKEGCALLTSGDRIVIDKRAPLQVDEDQFLLPAEVGLISVPRAYLSYYCRRVPDGVDDPARFLDGVAKGNRDRDVIYLKNGDRIEGVLAVPARGPTYQMKVGERTVTTPLDQIAVLVANSQLQARPRTKKTFAHVITKRGDRLQFSSLQLDGAGGMFSGRTLFGARLRLPLKQVALVTIRQGPAVYLSDMTPKDYKCTPFLDVSWPLALDNNVMGHQILLDGNYHDKGLGMHAASQVTYALTGKNRWFEAMVGLENQPGRPGQAKVSVLLDGVAILAGQQLNGADSPMPVRINVKGARELTLRVDFGERGDVRGRVNWADACLLGHGD